jgi:hypothetical protein
MMIAVIFIPFFAQNIQTLFAGQLLAGIPWGIFQTLSTAVSPLARVYRSSTDIQYASEVVPVALRPYLTAYVNLCWVIGQLIASGVLRGVLNWQAEWAFRVPFAMQCVSTSCFMSVVLICRDLAPDHLDTVYLCPGFTLVARSKRSIRRCSTSSPTSTLRSNRRGDRAGNRLHATHQRARKIGRAGNKLHFLFQRCGPPPNRNCHGGVDLSKLVWLVVYGMEHLLPYFGWTAN